MSTSNHLDPLAPLGPWLNDPDVEGIMVDGCDRVYVERHSRPGQYEDVSSPFRDDAHLLAVIRAVAESLGQPVDAGQPCLDARLAEDTRVHIIVPPIAISGPLLVIRKFGLQPLTAEDLLRFGAWDDDILAFLQAGVRGRLNILVVGGISSGKTTLLNIIAGLIPPAERIVTIEQATELRPPRHLQRVVRLETRPPDAAGQGAVTAPDLVWHALRLRPDRIILSEVLDGGAALLLCEATARGHDGNLMTLHANSPRDALARLEILITSANPSIPLLNVRQQMAAALDLVVHLERLRDGTRKVLKVTEVAGMAGDAVALQDIFEFRQTGVKDGKVAGCFTATGYSPRFLDRIRAAGVELPMSLFTPR